MGVMDWHKRDVNEGESSFSMNLRRKFGLEGYGAFTLLKDRLYQNDGVMNDEDLETFCYYERIDDEWMDKLLEYLIKLNCIERQGDYIFSREILDDIKSYKDQAAKKSAAAFARWNKKDEIEIQDEYASDSETDKQSVETANAETQHLNEQNSGNADTTAESVNMQTECKCNADKMQVHSECNAKRTEQNRTEKKRKQQQQNRADAHAAADTLHDDYPSGSDSIMIPDDDIEFDPDIQVDGETGLKLMLIHNYGFLPQKADEVCKQYSLEYIIGKIKLLDKTTGINNAAAWLIQAIERDYQTPKVIAPQPTATQNKHAGLGGEDYEGFKREYKRIFNRAFADVNKPCYIKACFELNSPSLVIKLLRSIEEAGAEWYMRFATANKIESIEMLMQSRDLADKFYAAFSRDFPPQSISLGGHTA